MAKPLLRLLKRKPPPGPPKPPPGPPKTKQNEKKIYPTRRIVYSASFSGNFQGSFWGCARLFGDYSGVILEVFVKDFEGKTIRRVKEKIAKTELFTIKNTSG